MGSTVMTPPLNVFEMHGARISSDLQWKLVDLGFRRFKEIEGAFIAFRYS